VDVTALEAGRYTGAHCYSVKAKPDPNPINTAPKTWQPKFPTMLAIAEKTGQADDPDTYKVRASKSLDLEM